MILLLALALTQPCVTFDDKGVPTYSPCPTEVTSRCGGRGTTCMFEDKPTPKEEKEKTCGEGEHLHPYVEDQSLTDSYVYYDGMCHYDDESVAGPPE